MADGLLCKKIWQTDSSLWDLQMDCPTLIITEHSSANASVKHYVVNSDQSHTYFLQVFTSYPFTL